MLFAKYVDDNAEKFRSKIVSFEGKKELRVCWNYDDPNLFYNPLKKDFPWDLFTDKFSGLIKKNVKGELGDIMINNFSTTSKIEKCASEIALMSQC